MKFIVFLLTTLVLIPNIAIAQRSDSIASVVNSDVITYTDLYDRIDLVIKSSKMPNTKEFKERLLPQVLTALITEQIQLQKADELNLPVTQEEIDKGFANLAGQNNLTADQFKKILRSQHVNIATLETQIKSQLVWGKVIQTEIRPRVRLTDSDINDEIERLKLREGQEEFFVAEIFLPVGKNANESEIRKGANDLSKQLTADIRKFPAAARQFSQSATSANGGIIGWITPDQLESDLALSLKNLQAGGLSTPIKTDDGYTILFLREKRTISLTSASDEERLRIKVAHFTLPDDKNSRKLINDEVDMFTRDVKGCLDIIKRVTKLDQARLQEYNDTKSKIPARFVTAVKDTDIGDLGTSITTEKTIQIPMLCGREGGGGEIALKREIEERMGIQRMNILQKRYLRDLIAEAYIERRV